MAQLMGKETGLSRGKDSFLHGGDLEHGIFGSTSMLGSSLPVAVGAALKFQIKREKHIAVVVSAIRPANHLVDILIAVIIDVTEGDRMTLLEDPKSSGSRHILETFPSVIAKHPRRDDH